MLKAAAYVSYPVFREQHGTPQSEEEAGEVNSEYFAGAPENLNTRLVMMAEGNHAYPYRTRPLSLPAPMVLGPKGPGRVGRCQAYDMGP